MAYKGDIHTKAKFRFLPEDTQLMNFSNLFPCISTCISTLTVKTHNSLTLFPDTRISLGCRVGGGPPVEIKCYCL